MSEAVRFEESLRTTASGRASAASSEREFYGVCDTTCTKEYVYAQFLAFIRDGRVLDFWGNPLAEADGITVESVDAPGRVWLCRARYEKPSPTETVESESASAEGVEFGAFPVSFSTTGGTARRTTSLGTTAYSLFPGVAAPDFGGLIGWNGEGFDGVEIVAPKFAFTIEKRTPSGMVANFAQFAREVADYVGKVNSKEFYGFSPGVVLFLGVSSGSLQTQEATETTDAYSYWRANYEFAASPNATIRCGNVDVFKPGWAAFWRLTQDAFDATTGRIVPTPVACYVEKCYEEADFDELGL